jgi:transcription-repair coupling factor (superfamily II helicase)
METILDYMQDCLIVLDDTIETVWNNQWERIEERFTQNKSAPPPSINRKTEHSGVEFSHNILPTHDLFIDWDTWSHAIQRFPVYTISPHQLPPEPKILNKDWRQGQTFFHERKKADGSLFRAVIEHIRKKISNGSIVVVASYSEGSSIRLRSLLRDYDLHNTTTTENWMDVCKAGNAGIVYFTVWKIPHGFETDTLTVISEKDIFGEALVSKPKVSRDIKRLLRETNNFSIGDIVVHKQHGIGRYQGLETLKIDSAPHDCLIIVYEGSDKLYLPIENIDLLSRYGNNENANLDKLGGKAWKNRKAKAKKYLLEIAEKLVHIAAMRATQSGENFSADPDAYGQFCTGFGHEETPDQISAIDDVIMDLSSGRPMNRIICGDVGFGKTEIAIRATFIVAMAGHQVAIITPTTLLARQHYQSFSNRFENWPFRIAQLR